MKFEKSIDYGPEKSPSNFGSDPEHILKIVCLPVRKDLRCYKISSDATFTFIY